LRVSSKYLQSVGVMQDATRDGTSRRFERGILDTQVEHLSQITYARARNLVRITERERAWEVKDWLIHAKRMEA